MKLRQKFYVLQNAFCKKPEHDVLDNVRLVLTKKLPIPLIIGTLLDFGLGSFIHWSLILE